MEKERFSGMFMDWVMTFLVVAILATVCNIVGYDGGFIESLPGMLIFGLISLAGQSSKTDKQPESRVSWAFRIKLVYNNSILVFRVLYRTQSF